MKALNLVFVALAIVLSVCVIAKAIGRQQIEQVGTHTKRELINGHWFYRYDDGVTVCAWADHIDVICTEKAQ